MPVRLPKKVLSLSAVFAKVSRMDLTVVYPGVFSLVEVEISVGSSFAASPAFALMACSFFVPVLGQLLSA